MEPRLALDLIWPEEASALLLGFDCPSVQPARFLFEQHA